MAQPKAEPGQVLRKMRLERGLTLTDLAGMCGLPISTLSKLETGKMSLSYDKLVRLSRALGIDIGLLFAKRASKTIDEEPIGAARRSVSRNGEGDTIETEVYNHVYKASDLLHKRFVPVVCDVKARSLEDFGEMIQHGGEEYAFVLEGVMELHTSQYVPLRLAAGDSIYFDSSMPHAYVAVGDANCRMLCICSGDEAQLRSTFGPLPAATGKNRPIELRSRRRRA